MPSYQQFRLPDVGEGLTEADIVSWAVTEGEQVAVNQLLCEIETAKSVVELPSPYAGVVHQLLAAPGATVEVGTPIIVIDVDPTGTPDGERPGTTATGAPTGAPEAAAEGSGSLLVGYGTKSAAPVRRKRRDADRVPAGARPPASAPAAVRPPAPAPVAVQPPAPAPAAVQPPAPAPVAVRPPAPASAPTPPPGTSPGSRVLAKPPVRKLAKDLGVDLSAVAGTGPGGIITREDVHAHQAVAEPRALATYPGDEEPWLEGGTVSADGRQTRVPARSVRRRTAEAMVSSAFTAPHVTVFQTVDVTKTMRLVERLRADREFADVKVTPLLVVMKALILAVRRNPEVNASWDDAAKEIVYKHYINLGIAADTPRGLVVPNIKDAHRLTLRELALALGELIATARAGRTTPAAMADGTISVTNIGIFGIDTGTPILNPGESAILAFGAISERPWVHHGRVKPRHVTQLALSFDHRLVDGALGSRVLADVARVLQDPAQALVWS